MSEEINSNDIVIKYNEIKTKYTAFFQKALELEDELREHKYQKIYPVLLRILYQLLNRIEDAGE